MSIRRRSIGPCPRPTPRSCGASPKPCLRASMPSRCVPASILTASPSTIIRSSTSIPKATGWSLPPAFPATATRWRPPSGWPSPTLSIPAATTTFATISPFTGLRSGPRERHPLSIRPGPGRKTAAPSGKPEESLMNMLSKTNILVKTGQTIALASALLYGTYAALGEELKIGPKGETLAVAASPELAAKLPEAFKTGATLEIATDPSQPPYTYYQADGQTLVGSD